MGTPNQPNRSPHPWDTHPMGNPLFLDPSHHPPFHPSDDADGEPHELGAMKEMIYKIAAMQPVDIDPASIKKPRRRNVRISDDPQSVAARHRRERISERIRILQRLVPGGTKMDTASMLDEAIRYVKFLKKQVLQLQMTSQSVPACSSAGQLPDSAADWPDRGGLEFPAAGRRGSSMG